jgi:hypothetical protein
VFNSVKLPSMRMVHQYFDIPPKADVLEEVDREWARVKNRIQLSPGSHVAVGVGSRGIANLHTVVHAVVSKLKEVCYKPFITPAMGSHGGATAEGQIEVLRTRGITEESVCAPIRASMAVESLGDADGIPLFVSRLAKQADGIVIINRVKPHTNFVGPTESGMLKMLGIGLGNQVGAEHYHRLAVVGDYYAIISRAGREVIKRCNVLFGVGLVENQNHETAFLKLALADEIELVETDLLKKARALLPMLPLDEIDLLIVDEMGKDISGEGIDPNVVGRDVCECGVKRSSPKITRIFVRDLSEGSEGSALGVGQADFTTKRLVDKIDFQATSINCLTCCCPESGRIPLTYANDKEAIAAAMMTLRPYVLDEVRIVHIKNTMELGRIFVSKGCLPELENKPHLDVDQQNLMMEFDHEGNLESTHMT